MKINYIKLTNFVGVYAAMGLKELELSFEEIDKPIIQIYGKNRCGKTVLIQQLHPFSSINLNGDERADLSLIIPGEIGVKRIIYEVDGLVYDITHTYQPTRSGGHSVASSIVCNNEELNPSGGVTVFNTLINKILGINKYTFQFIINGTQLTSFANMSTTQRKNLLNKAMGIDIYDKIHKLATDDYRYTNKLITSLNNTKEHILSQYGSYESLCSIIKDKQMEYSNISKSILDTKSRMDILVGEINTIKNQNPQHELMIVTNNQTAYKNVMDQLGSCDSNIYDKLVQEQIDLNNEISNLRNKRLLIKKDIDSLYEKKNNISETYKANMRAVNDFNNMVNMRDELIKKIDSLNIETVVNNASSMFYRSMIQPAQAINDICTEISLCLNDNHLKMFTDMIINGIDVAAFLIQEGSILMDSEKEMTVVSRIRRMIEGIEGDVIDKECAYNNCIYRRTHKMLEVYFKSYQSTKSSEFTEYDLEQIEHSHKNVMTINRLLKMDIPEELKDVFNIVTIMKNIQNKQIGIDISYIKYLMEQAALSEQRLQYISQLTNIEKTIDSMEKLLTTSNNNNDKSDIDNMINKINIEIESLRNEDNNITLMISDIERRLDQNDKYRLMLSQVRHLNINDLNNQFNKLTSLIQRLNSNENEYDRLSRLYNEMTNTANKLSIELKALDNAYNQYNSTVTEIEKHDSKNGKYKIIAEATSSTKGKPVIAIRETVENALSLTNRLLDIMYNGEIEMLKPIIDENAFTLPFRCGSHSSSDIRYGSQSENTLLSLALEMSLASLLSNYDVILVDEIDAYLDTAMHDSFLLMIQETMATLKIQQLFLISHSIQPGQYDHIVHTIDLSQHIIEK